MIISAGNSFQRCFTALLRFDAPAVSFSLFVSAVLLYALQGSPTPDHPGIVEALVGLLLTLSALPYLPALFTGPHPKGALWYEAGKILLLAGISLPLAIGIIAGNAPSLIIRDVIPFIFMMIPVLYVPLFRERPALFKPFLLLVLIAGALSAFRAFAESFSGIAGLMALLFPSGSNELYYLANVPTVLFSALFLTGCALHFFTGANRLRDIVYAGICAAAAGFILLPVALTLQRASLGFFILYTGIAFGVALIRRPRRVLLLLPLLLAALWPLADTLHTLFQALAHKTALVGVNMRAEDARAVWMEISGSPVSLLFGKGWGAVFTSPAAGGVSVNFTHNLPTSFLLKTGLSGLTLVLLYLYGLGRLLFTIILPQRPLLALALAGPLLIDLTLYASFKSLDFGLVLLVIPAACAVASEGGLLYSKRTLQHTYDEQDFRT
ncbi:MAG: hypothetical protein KDJ75_02265 [Alphaproteobacteria bacterium]|nr:hypothetical protein [Alphaproteobacteria bacterium]